MYVKRKAVRAILDKYYANAGPLQERMLWKINQELRELPDETPVLKDAPMGQWINVDEALPENHTNVIIARRISGEWYVEQGNRLTDGQWKVHGTRCRTVEFWMPLPDAPGGDGDA